MTSAWFSPPKHAGNTTARHWSAAAREELLDEPPAVDVDLDVVPGRTVLHVHHHTEHLAWPDLLAIAFGVLALTAWAGMVFGSWMGAPMPLRWGIGGVQLLAAAATGACLWWSWRIRRESDS